MNFVVKAASASVLTINVMEKGSAKTVAMRPIPLVKKTVESTFSVTAASASNLNTNVMEEGIAKMVAMKPPKLVVRIALS